MSALRDMEFRDKIIPSTSRSTTLSNINFRDMFFVALFMLFLYKYSIDIDGDGISANYLYILLPVIIILARGKLLLPNKNLQLIIALYILIFCLATIYQYYYIEFIDRRLISFVIFMSMFSYMVIKIDLRMVRSFKFAIALISIIYSLGQIYTYISLDLARVGFAGKDIVGSQRYGFVYILAICLLLQYFPRNKLLFILKFSGLTILLAGLLLTFSRSSIVAIIGSAGLYLAYKILMWLKRPRIPRNKIVFAASLYFFVFMAIILLLRWHFPSTFDLYDETLFSLNRANGDKTFWLDNPEASEGYRIFLFKSIVEFVFFNPFTGSGYLGVWVHNPAGSAHNQYTDVLFRTGVFGGCAYVFLLLKLLKFLHLREPGLFWGVIGILIYGLFHETFKESQGGFILAFLLGMMANLDNNSVASTHDSGYRRIT